MRKNMQPDLTRLLGLIEDMPSYRQLVAELEKKREGTTVAVLDAAKPYLVASLYRRLQRPMLVVTSQPERARKLHEQLLTWLFSIPVRLLPEPEALPYQPVVSDGPVETERISTLAALAGIAGDSGSSLESPVLMVASSQALMQKVLPHRRFAAASHTIEAGMEIEPFRLLERWQAMGYRLEDVVELPGMVSHRGGIIDIYPPTGDLPARLEFFGNTVESIRLFDPANQRSLRKVPAIGIVPASEVIAAFPADSGEGRKENIVDIDYTGLNGEASQRFEQELALIANGGRPDNMLFYSPLFNDGCFLDYLPGNALLVLDEPGSIKLEMADLAAKAGELRDDMVARGELPQAFPRPYFTWEEIEGAVKDRQHLELSSWGTTGDKDHSLDFIPAPGYAGQLPSFLKKVGEMLAQKQRLVLVSHQSERLSELLEEEGVIAPTLDRVKQVPPPGSLVLLQGLLAEGWVMNGDTLLLTDSEIFGFIKQQRLLRKRPVPHHRLFTDINPGDYVVHVEHGIGRFSGVTNLRAEGGEKEYLVLEYAAGDRLYVPTDQIDRVGRYVAAGERLPVLSRLGTQEWTRTKSKVQESVEVIARDLLELYATREVVPGYAFSPDTVWQHELEASFPYVETPDQLEAQKQVKEDMQTARPMDRLVCGDVGYGKTEVAIRAAFKAVMDGKQVAVLVPTTVLAEQHLATFSQRLGAFPLRVEVLSRFRTPREQSVILKDLVEGSVDICIGTHRLLQKDVAFKDLGL
ncbi:MAG: DEAD/DEAH box helicase, partial [Dehalococcoidales bacterium]